MDLVTCLLGNVSAMLALLEMTAASVSPLHTINTHFVHPVCNDVRMQYTVGGYTCRVV